MANQLAMDKVQAIKSLASTGMSERRIAQTVGISRKAVRRHLGRGNSKETKAPTGEASTGSEESKGTKAPTGYDVVIQEVETASRSLCVQHQDLILEKLDQGLTAQRIHQDLCVEHGFMALAIRFDGLIRRGDVTDQAELARLGHVTRARMTQIMNLLQLAPDIQEAILHLPRVDRGLDPIVERQLRPVAAVPDWRKQRRLWRQIAGTGNSST